MNQFENVLTDASMNGSQAAFFHETLQKAGDKRIWFSNETGPAHRFSMF
jgi:hypothetical protein